MPENLWSPWRSQYVSSADETNAESCFRCPCAKEEPSADNLVVAHFKNTMVVLNRYPYNAGHLLIAPHVHEGDLLALSDDVSHELMDVTRLTIKVVNEVLKPHAANVGANLGRHAGAGVPDHLHMHVVPRWNGDTNFMPTIAETKVVSDALEDLWQRFTDGFKAHA